MSLVHSAIVLSFTLTITHSLECNQFRHSLAQAYAEWDDPQASQIQIDIMMDYVLFSHSHLSSCFFVTILKRSQSTMSRREHSKPCTAAGGRLAWVDHEWRWNRTLMGRLTDLTTAKNMGNPPNRFQLQQPMFIFIGLHHSGGSYNGSVCDGWMWTNDDGTQQQTIKTQSLPDGNCTFVAAAYGNSINEVNFRIAVEEMNSTDDSYPPLMITEYSIVNEHIYPDIEVGPGLQISKGGPCEAMCEFVVTNVAASPHTTDEKGSKIMSLSVLNGKKFISTSADVDGNVTISSVNDKESPGILNMVIIAGAIFVIVIAISLLFAIYKGICASKGVKDKRMSKDVASDPQSVTAPKSDSMESSASLCTSNEKASIPNTPGNSDTTDTSKESGKHVTDGKNITEGKNVTEGKTASMDDMQLQELYKPSLPKDYEYTNEEPNDGTGSLDNIPQITHMEFKQF